MADTYDCQACGACCFSPWTGDGYVRLGDPDLERLHALSLPVIFQTQGYGDPPEVIPKLGTKVIEPGVRVCVAFEGRGGEACGCGIYPLRPDACRRFEAGSMLCQEARAQDWVAEVIGPHWPRGVEIGRFDPISFRTGGVSDGLV